MLFLMVVLYVLGYALMWMNLTEGGYDVAHNFPTWLNHFFSAIWPILTIIMLSDMAVFEIKRRLEK
jgi:hypothetical protein